MVLGDSLVGHGHLANRDGLPEHHYGCAVTPVGDHVLLLGSEGAASSRLHDQLEAFCCNGSYGKPNEAQDTGQDVEACGRCEDGAAANELAGATGSAARHRPVGAGAADRPRHLAGGRQGVA